MATSTPNGTVAGRVAQRVGAHDAAESVESSSGSASAASATPEDLRLALRAATLYYLDGHTQAEIATKLGVSRPTAGRLIARAKARGLVRIEVVVPPTMKDDLHADEERQLEARYGLTEAVVTGHLGRAAGALLMRRLSENDVLGFTWGPEQVDAVAALTAGVASCRTVVQLDGAMSTAAYQTGMEFILSRGADMLRANAMRLPAPLYADPSTVISMHSDSVISKTLETGRRADTMLFGVGSTTTSTTLFEGSFLDTRMLDELVSLGAVGEIGGRFFDAHGAPVITELAHRAVSVPLEDVRKCSKSILICSGPAKYRATLAALRGGLAKLFVCDIDCARWLLEQ